jgi:hypothetical protein
MTMGIAKGKGGSASEQRHLKQHGSASRRGMAKFGGQLERLREKPKGAKGPGKGR